MDSDSNYTKKSASSSKKKYLANLNTEASSDENIKNNKNKVLELEHKIIDKYQINSAPVSMLVLESSKLYYKLIFFLS